MGLAAAAATATATADGVGSAVAPGGVDGASGSRSATGVIGCGLIGELLADRAREFAEQAAAEALLGMPWQAAKGFTRALRIVPKGSAGRVELLLARAQVLSSLGKHEACAEVCIYAFVFGVSRHMCIDNINSLFSPGL